MPKKTKREKIIAEYRRKLQSFDDTVGTNQHRIDQSPMSRLSPPSSPFVYQINATHSQSVTPIVQPFDHVIRRDLTKTLILAAIAIGGEVVLSILIK